MPTYEAHVDGEGRILLPPELVEKLAIRPGQRVEFFETLDGEIFFHAVVETTAGWKGILNIPGRHPPISNRQINESIADAIADDDDRIRRQSPAARGSDPHDRSAAE